MDSNIVKFRKHRLRSSYISVVISISLVLFLFGLLGLTFINMKTVSNSFKETLTMSIYMSNQAKKVEINQLRNKLLLSSYVKKLKFISKEEAASIMKVEYGEEFINELGFNPLVNSIDINLISEFVNKVKLDSIKKLVLKNKYIEEVEYDTDLVTLMNTNLKKITLWILPISTIFALISFLIINSSIKLSIYSNRFVIKTMQMVGSRKSFIRRPIIYNNIGLSILSSIIAILLLIFLINYIDTKIPILNITTNNLNLYLFLSIVLLGVFISWISSYLATQKLLNLNTDNFYN